MADSRQSNNSGNDLPTPENTASPSQNDTFPNDKEFFEALEASVRKASGPRHTSFGKTGTRLLRIEVILLVGAAAIALALVLRFCKQRLIAPGQMPLVSVKQQTSPLSKPIQPQPSDTQPLQTVQTESPIGICGQSSTPTDGEKPLSLELANNSFIQDDYQGAFRYYERLDQALPQDPEQQLMHSFLKLRMAICLELMNQTDQAEKLLGIVCADDSCALMAIANYQRALIEFERKQYLEARTFAYRAMALCEAVTADTDWALTLKKDCHFLIALSLTRRITDLSGADADIPAKMWRTSQQTDFGCNLTESELEAFIKSGNKRLVDALMGPKIKKLKTDLSEEHFEAVSNTVPAEELLARFASNVDTRLVWNLSEHSNEIRRRPVSVFLPDVTNEEFFSIAAGCAGLRATIDPKAKRPTVTITNPADYTELSLHVSSIADEALERWQEFVIKYYEDKRLANVCFACGIIYQVKGQTVDAIAQFKLLANRYAHSSLAPYALLYSSKIKTDLCDYAGAKQDLKQLVEQYQQTTIAQIACLRLADAAMAAGLYDEAANTYCKVYNLDDSAQSRAAAAMGAAQASFATGDYASAETWLTRHINLAIQQDHSNLHNAYLLLGKAQLEQGERLEAFNAFKLALHGELTLKDRTEIIAALLKCDLDNLDPIQALDILETLASQGLSSQEATEAILMKCRILRKIQLPEKAMAVLNDRFDYILEPQLRAKAYFEQGELFMETGQIENAFHSFTVLLAKTEPGPLADQAALKLAELSLKLNKDDKAIELCSQLLDRHLPADLRQAAVRIMAQAYNRQKNYEKGIDLLLEESENLQSQKLLTENATADRTSVAQVSSP